MPDLMNTLRKYFDKASNLEPSFSVTQLEELIDHNFAGQDSPSMLRRLFRRRAVSVTSMLGICVCVVGLVSLLGSDGRKELRAGGLGVDSSEIHDDVMEVWDMDNDAEMNGSRVFGKPIAVRSLRLIELNNDELARLGIQISGDSVRYYYRQNGKVNSSVLFPDGFQHRGVEDATSMADGRKVVIPDFSFRLLTDDIGRRRAFRFSFSEVMPASELNPSEKLRRLLFSELQKHSELSPRNADESIDTVTTKPQGKIGSRAVRDHSGTDSTTMSLKKRYFSEVEEKLQFALDRFGDIRRLVPVLVRTGYDYTSEDSLAGLQRPHYIFWYDATPELLAALPERVRVELERDLAAVDAMAAPDTEINVPSDTMLQADSNSPKQGSRSALAERGAKQSSDTTRRISTTHQERSVHRDTVDYSTDVTTGRSSYVEPKGYSGAVISLEIHPNPAHHHAMIKCRLSTARRITISLHTVTGVQLRNFAEDDARGEGEWSAEIDISEIPSGIYLIVMTSDRGEQVVKRLAVE